MEILPTNLLHLPITLIYLENSDLPSKNSENQLNINSKNPKKSNEYLHFSVGGGVCLLSHVIHKGFRAQSLSGIQATHTHTQKASVKWQMPLNETLGVFTKASEVWVWVAWMPLSKDRTRT